MAVVVTAALSGCQGGSPSAAAQQNVVVDVSALRQSIDGFGSTERVWNDPHLSDSTSTMVPAEAQGTILRFLYGRLGLTRVRPFLDEGIQLKPGGSFNFAGKLGDAHIAYVKQARRYGLRTVFPAPVYFEEWVREDNVAAYVDYAMGVLLHWRSQGVPLKLFSPINEPQISHKLSPEWMRRMVVLLGARMRAAGLQTRLVIPDDVNPSDAYRRAAVVMADPAARRYVGPLAFHIYGWSDADIVRMKNLAARYGRHVWMTEYENTSYGAWPAALEWAVKMHRLLTEGNVNAVDYLWAFFGSWVRSDTMISIRFDHGAYRGFDTTPIYYLTGQFSRYVRPGYRRVQTKTSAGPVLVSAFSHGRRLVIVAVNTAAAAQRTRFALRGVRLRGPLAAVRTSADDQWRQLPALRSDPASFATTLTPESVTTFLGRTR